MSEPQPGVDVIVLGSGTSHGIPMIGCDCEVCTSADPRDRRLRPSIFVRVGGVRILVDTAPELRLQCVANGVTMIDAILYTHHHADHVVGLDDLRRFNWLKRTHMACYGSPDTLERVRRMFPYAFAPDKHYPSSKPNLELNSIDDRPFDVGGATVMPIPLMHGTLPIFGFRFGGFAYCTDCSLIPEDSMRRLRGVDVLVLDALRRRPHPTHFNLEQAVDAAKRIGARRTYFTHIAHALMHAPTNAELPDGMELAFDGLEIHTP